MKRFLAVSLILASCQVNNSNSGDNIKFAEGASSVFQNRCAQCHQYASLESEDFVNQGLVIPGAPAESPLFQRLRGSNVGGAEDMPPVSAGEITLEEVKIIENWIINL